jgi:hypothetical protein
MDSGHQDTRRGGRSAQRPRAAPNYYYTTGTVGPKRHQRNRRTRGGIKSQEGLQRERDEGHTEATRDTGRTGGHSGGIGRDTKRTGGNNGGIGAGRKARGTQQYGTAVLYSKAGGN